METVEKTDAQKKADDAKNARIGNALGYTFIFAFVLFIAIASTSSVGFDDISSFVLHPYRLIAMIFISYVISNVLLFKVRRLSQRVAALERSQTK
jgi:hypothetical protein